MSYNIHSYDTKKIGSTITTNDERGKVGSVRGNRYSTRDAYGLVGKSPPTPNVKNQSKDVPVTYKTTTLLVNYENPLIKPDIPYYDQLGQKTAKEIASQISVPANIFQRGVKQTQADISKITGKVTKIKRVAKDIRSSLLEKALSSESKTQEGKPLPLQTDSIPPTPNQSFSKDVERNRAKTSQLFKDELDQALAKRAEKVASNNFHIGDLAKPFVPHEVNKVPLVELIRNFGRGVNGQSTNISVGATPMSLLPKGDSDFNKPLPALPPQYGTEDAPRRSVRLMKKK